MSKDRNVHPASAHERRPAEAEPQGKGPSGTPAKDEASEGKAKPRLPLQLKITPLDGRDTLKYEDVADK